MGVETVIFESTDERVHLCMTCTDELKEFIQKRKEDDGPKRPGRPARKNQE